MPLSIIKYYILGNIVFLSCLSCTQETKQEKTIQQLSTEQAETTPLLAIKEATATASATTTPTINKKQLGKFFAPQEATSMNRVKQVFDEGLKGVSKNRTLPELYRDHAQRMRMDYFNKYPYTLNYPYNDKFDLSLVQAEIPNLSFLNKKCGFQIGDPSAPTNIYHYCLSNKGSFIDFMEDLSKENTLIANLHKDYISKKTISPEVKQLLVINSLDDLDFDKPEHQVVYMFYQILINEERLASNQLKAYR